MRFWRKQHLEEANPYDLVDYTPPGEPVLPGIAGYRGIDPLPKLPMPQTRFNYVRPDRKRQA